MAYRRKAALVLIASSNMQLMKRWRRSLKGDFAVLGVEDAAALEQGMAQFNPPILLLDLALIRNGRTRSVTRLQSLSPASKIIVFSRTPNHAEGISLLKSGVIGYCEKNIDSVHLMKAVNLVARGEMLVGRKLIPFLIRELTSLTDRRQKRSLSEVKQLSRTLTYRQREIVALIGSGARNKEIASQLCTSEKTVKAHLTAIFRKLGISNRMGLALFANEYRRLPVAAATVNKRVTHQPFKQIVPGARQHTLARVS